MQYDAGKDRMKGEQAISITLIILLVPEVHFTHERIDGTCPFIFPSHFMLVAVTELAANAVHDIDDSHFLGQASHVKDIKQLRSVNRVLISVAIVGCKSLRGLSLLPLPPKSVDVGIACASVSIFRVACICSTFSCWRMACSLIHYHITLCWMI